jgi:hypothetical protein
MTSGSCGAAVRLLVSPFVGLLILGGCRSAEAPQTTPAAHPTTEPCPAAPPPQPVAGVPAEVATPRSTLGKTRLGGPTQGITKAVVDGLRWLARHQNPDGSWGALSLRSRCVPDASCYDANLKATGNFDEGLTGLALLCFLRAGYSHESKQDLVDTALGGRYRIGEVVKKGLEWLRKRQNPDGSFSRDRAFMYNEALATMALAEAYGLTRNHYWKEPAQRGIDFITESQRPNPSGQGLWGWRYASRKEIEHLRKGTKELFDSDTSVTTWCVLALESARRAGLQVKQESMDGAMEFCKFVTANDGLVGYLDAKGAGATVTGPYDTQFTYHWTTMSALGMCLRIFATHNPNDPFLKVAAKRLVQDLPTVSEDHSSVDYYYWFFASLALNQLDGPDSPERSGKYWDRWNKAMVEAVLPLQDHTEHACTNGGWIVSDRWGSSSGAGPLYNTAINVLTLEVCYRYENAFGGRWGGAPNTAVGSPAPDFACRGSDTSRLALSDYRGRVVVIDFWAPGSPNSESALAARSELAARLRERSFSILGVALYGDSRYLDAAGQQTPVWRCTEEAGGPGSIRSEYRVQRPTTVVVDALGTIRGRDLSWEETVALVERLLGDLESQSKPK